MTDLKLIEKLDKVDRIKLANLPTPIYKLDRISGELGRNILFLHTGGQYGLFPKQGQMEEVL